MIARSPLLNTAIPVIALTVSVLGDDSQAKNFQLEIQPILREFCFACHGAERQEADLRIDTLSTDLTNGPDTEIWHDALNQLNLGEMPPATARQPTTQQRQLLTQWILDGLRDAAAAKRYQEGRVVTRRLTRYEYANTMRDLLLVDLDFARDLPPEPASNEGFLNNGATLEMSPAQVEIYLETARRALAEAIVTGDRPELYEFKQTETAVGNLPTRPVAGHQPVLPEFILDLRNFPRQGEFEVKVSAKAAVPAGEDFPRIQVSMGHVPGIIHVPRKVIGEADVTEQLQTFTFRGRMEDLPQPGPVAFGNSGFQGMIVMVDFLNADGKQLRYEDQTYAQKVELPRKKNNAKEMVDAPEPAQPPTPVPFGNRLDIMVTSAEFRGPIYSSWPPESHQHLLFDSKNSSDEPQYVREVLRKFMKAACRRPVTQEEIEQTANVFAAIRPRTGSFEEAIRETLASVLVSPHFLYLVEYRSPGKPLQRVTEYELASRLAYFLWSSQPDQELISLADEGRLTQPDVLKMQATRMLDDLRSEEFVRHFADQWLDLDALDRVAVNPEFFSDFDHEMKDHMRREAQVYLARVLREERSALEFLDSDWAILNRPLAKHYGLQGPRSSQFERVDLTSPQRRGGLLTQGAFLLANSNGEDSHPIKRAVWILDRLLDSPPASPPPDVPELNPESPDLAKLTLKEQLAIHRRKESCLSCHQGIDPWGIPLEHFDAVGRWRDSIPAHRKRPTTTVDATSVLPDGTKINGLPELQRFLVEERRDWFARAVVKRIMIYGLGRSLDLGDREAVDALTQKFEQNDLRLKTLVVDFILSETFQTK